MHILPIIGMFTLVESELATEAPPAWTRNAKTSSRTKMRPKCHALTLKTDPVAVKLYTIRPMTMYAYALVQTGAICGAITVSVPYRHRGFGSVRVWLGTSPLTG